jgi:hypothetical protein
VYESETAVPIEVQDVLAPGERLLWHGRPKQGFALRGLDAVLIPFSIIWTCGILYFYITALSDSGGLLLFAVLSPFLLIGLYLLAGRFRLDARLRANTYYALTSQRIIVITEGRSRRVHTIKLDQIVDVQLTHRADGTGTLEFPTSHFYVSLVLMPGYNRSLPWASMVHIPPAFEMIADGKKVSELIQQLRAGVPPDALSPAI